MTEQPEPNRITAATDGSSRGSPGAGGWGWVTDAGRCDWGSEPRATHIRMELTAVLKLLCSHPRERLLIQSDNKYVIDVFTKWLSQWRKRNMRKADGKPPKHLDIIEENRHVTNWGERRMAVGKGTCGACPQRKS